VTLLVACDVRTRFSDAELVELVELVELARRAEHVAAAVELPSWNDGCTLCEPCRIGTDVAERRCDLADGAGSRRSTVARNLEIPDGASPRGGGHLIPISSLVKGVLGDRTVASTSV